MLKKIGIIGLGLIGGSLAKAVKSYDKSIKVTAVDIDRAALDAALAEGVINEGAASVDKTLCGADIVIVCTGPERVVGDINAVFDAAGADTLITDVCSVKDFLPAVNKAACYVGGHPMAGTEKSGYKNSCGEMFRGRRYIITEATEGGRDYARLSELIELIGAKAVVWDNNAEHDRELSKMSHLPQVTAYVLAGYCTEGNFARHLTGGGFKDTTRIASSAPALWTEIVRANKENLLTAIEGFQQRLTELREKIAADDKAGITEIFQKGKEGRDGIC